MHIGLVIYPGCIPSGLFAFSELLEIANQRSGKRHFDTSWVGIDTEPMPLSISMMSNHSSATDLLLTPQKHVTDEALDAILLPGMWIKSVIALESVLQSHKTLINSIARLDQKTLTFSYCSAVALVAKAGKLDDCQATSTWWLAEYLKREFDKVNWRFSRTCLFCETNTTASGVHGYLPIALSLIEERCGIHVRRHITKLMMLPSPATEQQPSHAMDLMTLNDPLMRRIYLWVEKTPAAQLSISALAEVVHSSERTLARKIKSETGESCKRFMQLIKLNQATESLALTSTPINVISEQLGYLDDTSFRRSFKSVTGYTPSKYRQTFGRRK